VNQPAETPACICSRLELARFGCTCQSAAADVARADTDRAPYDHDEEAAHRRGVLVAAIGDLFDATTLDEMAFAIRTSANDRHVLEQLRTLLDHA
jgi:hypothetical protein